MCIFCKIINKEILNDDIIFENNHVLVMLDQDWAVKGHVLVIWKRHEENISDLTIEEYALFSEIVYRAEKALIEELQVDKSVILKSGGLVSHFHFHIYPIFKEMTWEQIKDMFDKKIKHTFSKQEKDNLIKNLKKSFYI